MGTNTNIKWTDHSFNPWWGCAKVEAPGDEPSECDSCYADTFAKRTGWTEGGHHDAVLWGRGAARRFFGDKHWNEPRKWDREAAEAGVTDLVFCASMADVFEGRDDLDPDRARLWDLIERTPNLRWQLLTKRPEQILRRVPASWLLDWPPNAWVGTTVEDQHFADLRVPRLLEVPAPVRFLSIEPLLGEVVLRPEWLVPPANLCGANPKTDEDRAAIAQVLRAAGRQLGWRGIDWAIIGGESGPGYRQMDLGHARAVAAQLTGAGVPTFFKQVSGTFSGVPGPPDLEALKGFPPEAGPRDGTPVEVGS